MAVETRTRKVLRRTALSISLSLCVAGGVHAQAITGGIYGTVPAGGETTTVQVTSNTGLTRTVTVDANGRYNFSTLPAGNYKVNVIRDGQVIGTRDVTVLVGAGTDVSFSAASGAGASASNAASGDASTLETITVVGTAASRIDITAVDTRSVVTKEQLERMPIRETAEAVALLSPGAVSGAAGYFGGMVSFGGSGISENAYYLNGFFTGEPISNLGGVSLPWGVISQQETYTGGYGAKYGRSAGGVISQVGQRGSNEWTFGGQISFSPKSLREDPSDRYFPDLDLPAGYAYANPARAGTLYSRGKGTERENITYSAYVGGPIVQDRLFFFAGGDMATTKTVTNAIFSGNRNTHGDQDNSKLYVKLDWNITDNHILEGTFLRDKLDYSGKFYSYDFGSGTEGALVTTAVPTPDVQENEYRILSYTGFLTNNLTLNATYGESDTSVRQYNPLILPGVPLISNPDLQNPAITGGSFIPNRQGDYLATDYNSETKGLRLDVEWVLGDHALTAGIDNIEFKAFNAGDSQVAQRWIYGKAANGTTAVAPGLGVGAAGGNGYFVYDYKYSTATDMTVEQDAWYLEDRWQATDKLLVVLGVRNDKFVNKNDRGETYMDAKNQWAPRLGFAYDVAGDGTFKLFGNVGRYFLALPNNVAIRGASSSTFTREYFTYSGIDSNGGPTGLTPIQGTNGAPPPGVVSSNGEFGQPVDVLAFAPSDLKNMYQDEYILGFETQVARNWLGGAKLTFRDLKSSVDDICDPYTLMDAIGVVDYEGAGSGYNAQLANGKSVFVNYCYMFNPGGTNTFSMADLDANGNPTGTRSEFVMSASDWGFTDPLRRQYKAVDLYLERPFDGKWEARFDYTYSKSEGNNEGQVKSEFGQDNISKTQDWDAWQMMQFADGALANDRRHQFKARGSYAFAEDWLVSANLRVQSGGPISCLGFFNPDGSIDENSSAADPIGYGSSYHTCFGEIQRPGSQRNPWTNELDLALAWTPQLGHGRVRLSMQVFNVFDQQKTTQVNVTSQSSPYTISNTYLLPIGRQTPRTVMFTAAYNY